MGFFINVMEDKNYSKLTKQDFDIAEKFFQNDKHLDEFVSNVTRYYLGKSITIKTKIVQRYFETYKKTMDFVINAREEGKKGGIKRIENQTITENTLQGVVKDTLQDTLQANNKRINDNSKEIKEKESKNLNSVVVTTQPSQDYLNFVEWCKVNCSRILQMKEPLTDEQFQRLKIDYGSKVLIEYCTKLHNYKKLTTNYISANLTLRNWIKRDLENNPKNEQNKEVQLIEKIISAKPTAIFGNHDTENHTNKID